MNPPWAPTDSALCCSFLANLEFIAVFRRPTAVVSPVTFFAEDPPWY